MNEEVLQYLAWLQQQQGNPQGFPINTPNYSDMQGYTQNMWNTQPVTQQTPIQPNFRVNNTAETIPAQLPDASAYAPTPQFGNYATTDPIQQGMEITGYVSPDAQPLNTNLQKNNQQSFQNFLQNGFSTPSVETSTFKLGQSLAFNNNNPYASDKAKGWNTVRGIAAGGATLASLLRTGLSGAAYQQRTNDSLTDYYQRQNQQDFVPLSYEDGGLSQEQYLTGSYVGEMPQQANAEIEKNEYLQYPDGQVMQAVGDTHEQGGIEVNLPNNTRVVSDNLKLGGVNARELKKEYDIDVKADNTFAEAIDKYKKKIGLLKLDKEQEELFKKLQGNSETKDEETGLINEGFLAQKIQETEEAKLPLTEQLSAFTDTVFKKQEEIKGDAPQVMFENGGQFTTNQLKEMYAKHGLTEEQGQNLLSSLQQFQNGGGTYQFYTPSQYAQEPYGYQSFVPGSTSTAGFNSQEDILVRLQYQNQTLPYIVNSTGLYNDRQLNSGNIGNFQSNYDAYVGATIAEIDANPYLTPAEKARNKQIAQSQRLSISNRNGQYDNVYGQETSSRTSFTLPYLKQTDREKYGDIKFVGDVIDENGKIKTQYKDLSEDAKKLIQETYTRSGKNSLNIGLDVVREANLAQPQVAAQQGFNQLVIPTGAGSQFGALNLIDQTLPPPSALQPSRLPDAQYRNYETVQQSADPQLQMLYNQEAAAVEQIAGLSPAQRAIALTQISANTQGAANQVIGQVNNANQVESARINNLNTQLFNQYGGIDQSERERFEQKTFAGMANAEQSLNSWYQYNNQLNAINQQQQNQASTLANLFSNYTLDANGNVVSNGVSPTLSNPLAAYTTRS